MHDVSRLAFFAALVVAGCSGSGSPVGDGSTTNSTIASETNKACSATQPCTSGLVCGGQFGCFVPDCSKEGVGTGCPDGFYCVDPSRDGPDALTNKRRYCARFCAGKTDSSCVAPNACSEDIDPSPSPLCLADKK